MMLPRACTLKIPGDYGQVWISESIASSKPDPVRNVKTLFERMTTAKRRANSYRGAATRMAQKFANQLTIRKER